MRTGMEDVLKVFDDTYRGAGPWNTVSIVCDTPADGASWPLCMARITTASAEILAQKIVREPDITSALTTQRACR